MPRTKSFRCSLLLLFMVAIGLVACGVPPVAAPGTQQPSAQPATAPAAKKSVIKLAENPWTGSQVNVEVAKLLLQDKLGYPVEVVTVDENAQWPAIAKGDLHASLEVWPSGHANDVKQYIDEQKVIEKAGALGPVGKIGWYIPKYMVDAHPELATWEGFKDPEMAGLFATVETGAKGQFLSGDPSWVQYDDQIINNLGLDLQVVVAGSEEAILASLDSAYSRKAPVLFYFWTPHSVHAKYDLTEVKLPAYSQACYDKAAAGGVDCDYPPDDLFKVVWPGLKEQAPDAYAFLNNFNYTTMDQIEMVADVELNDKTVDAAAQAWIDKHPDTWQAWLP